MFSVLISFLLFFIVTIKPVNAQLAEESTPSAQIIPTEIPIIESTPTPIPTDIASTLTEIILIPTETPILIPTLIPTSTSIPTPEISTDKADYSPTDIAIISGHNFLPNTQFILNITSDNLNVNYSINSDESGYFIYNYQLDGVYRPNYKVEVKDSNNNLISIITFTDRREVLSAVVNGSNSVSVLPEKSITVSVSVNTDWWWFWNNDWKSTSWRFGSSGDWNCVDTPDHLKSGDYSESFNINAPLTPEKYQLQIRVHGGENCGLLRKSNIFTLKDAIIVLIPDTTSPIITIDPYNTNPTNQNIIVSASTNEGTLNAISHAFESNDSFTFIATDESGNISQKTVDITNIDKIIPTANITYSNLFPTNDFVIATLNPSENITVTNNSGLTTYTFCQNGSFSFEFTDNASNIGGATATVENIDKTPPIINISQYISTPTNQNITIFASTNEGTLNNDFYTFTQNGSFTFIATDDAGNFTTKTININNIDKKAPILLNKTEFGNNWYNTDQLSVFNFIDDNGVVSGNNPTCKILNEGSSQTCFVNLNVCDTAGNCNTDLIFSNGANIDKSKPIINTFINPSLPDANNNWYKTQPEINLNVIEDNLFFLQYKWDNNNEWINYIFPVKPSSQGVHTLYFQAQDLASNKNNGFVDVKWDQNEPIIAPQNVTANPNNTSSSVSTIKWDSATDNIGIDKYEIKWTLNNLNNPLSYSKTVNSDIREIELDKLIEGRWTVQVIAIDQSGLRKDSAIDLFIIKNKEIVSSSIIPIKKVFAQKESSTISSTPTPTPVPTVLGTAIIKNKFNFKWLFLFLPSIPLYFMIRKYKK